MQETTVSFHKTLYSVMLINDARGLRIKQTLLLTAITVIKPSSPSWLIDFKHLRGVGRGVIRGGGLLFRETPAVDHSFFD